MASYSAMSRTLQVSPTKWSLGSWRTKRIQQIPEYPNKTDLAMVIKSIEKSPPLVFAGEARQVEREARLAEAAAGHAFVLQGGDCAESFKEFSADTVKDTFRVLLQMGIVLSFGGQMPIAKVMQIKAYLQ
jgi:3-deoxy-7-phosphoheptulonate synthase